MQSKFVFVCFALSGVSLLLSGCKDAAIEKYVSPPAIDAFIKLEGTNDGWLDAFCENGLTMKNITGNIYWPDCGLDAASQPPMHGLGDSDKCKKDGCVSKSMLEGMDAFNKKYGGTLVTYKSRAGKDADGKDIPQISLSGWWLPAPHADANTPRIVVQHGFTDNSNKYRQQLVAYTLRKLGFSVLINNLRDHCYSHESKSGIIGWGHAYPLDELGAWDYAKDHAAEPIDAAKVGIMGFSMGGFTTANAFGLEGEVPAAWIDGAPLTPKNVFEDAFVAQLPHEALDGVLTDSVWEDILKHAETKGVNINGHLPEKEMPKGPDTKRPIFVSANRNDGTVPFENSEKLVDLLKKYPEKYELKEFWVHDGNCIDSAHCVDHLIEPSEYEAKLCTFWSGVFKTDPKCGQGEVEVQGEVEGQGEGEGQGAKDAETTLKLSETGPNTEDDQDKGSDVTKLYEAHGTMLHAAGFSTLTVASLLALGVGSGAITRRATRRALATRTPEQRELLPSSEED